MNLIYLFLIFFLIFNFYFLLDLFLPPKIKIYYPKNKQVVYSDTISFKGKADKRGYLFINNLPVYFNENGYFEKTFYLKEGLNRFIILERKFWGQEKKINYEIIYLHR
jgi:hypothetical protein